MVRSLLAGAILAAVPVVPQAQSASAPLTVTAKVISTCKVDVPGSLEPSRFSTLPVSVTCVRRGASARVQRPSPPPRRSEQRDALLIINF